MNGCRPKYRWAKALPVHWREVRTLFFMFLFMGAAWAGPVPGVETIAKSEVDFPTPPGITVWQTAEDDYLVTFRWTPAAAVSSASVAGSFNNWNARDLPMSGPGGDGSFEVTARLPAGAHHYKIVYDGNWIADPGNAAGEDDGHGGKNSVLKLGLFAKHENLRAARGDGELIEEAFLHDPAQFLYRDAMVGGEVLLRFRTLHDDAASVTLVMGDRRRAMSVAANDGTYDYWEERLAMPFMAAAPSNASPGNRGGVRREYGFEVADGPGKVISYGKRFPLRREAEKLADTPEWARDAIWYQIMVDRFRDGDASNNAEYLMDPKRPRVTHPWKSDWSVEQPYEREAGYTLWRWSVYNRLYGGDFAGLMGELDYLKSLGVNALYLNPVFEAHTPHKYNARNYVHADDGYGKAGEHAASVAREDLLDAATWEFNESDKLLLKLIEESHRRGMRIIFDGVFNHVGDDHPAFLDVKENGRASRFADWFRVESWEPFEYHGWGGFGGLPEFAKTETGLASESLTRHIYDVTRRWMDPNGDGDPSDGIDGWRLDVPNELPKQFWADWRRHVKSINPDAYIVGEIWDPAEMWLDGTTFDAVMNYQFAKLSFQFFGDREKKILATDFDNRLARLRIRYPSSHTRVLQNLFDSHDTDRWVSRLANPDLPYDGANRVQDSGPDYRSTRPSETDYARLKLMAVFQATYIGAPMIYYGTEIGMFGADDPHNRMPMWWDDLMPFDLPEYRADADLREHFRALFFMRHQNGVLRRGEYRTAIADDAKDVFGYYRFDRQGPEALLVVLNNSGTAQHVTIPVGSTEFLPRRFASYMQISGGARIQSAGGALEIELAPLGWTVVQISRESGN